MGVTGLLRAGGAAHTRAMSRVWRAFAAGGRGSVASKRAVLFGVLSRAWSLGSGPLTLWLIGVHLTPQQQGYHYTFGSIVAWQVFAELGLAQIIQQFASHEWAYLRLTPDGTLTGDARALTRLRGIGAFSLRWYGVIAVLVAAAMSVGGAFLFGARGQGDVDWAGPWLALCAATGASLVLLPLWSLLEGCGQLTQVYQMRLVQSVLGSVAAWSTLMLGHGLWASPATSLTVTLVGLIFVSRYSRAFGALRRHPGAAAQFNWRREIWPLQWRSALTWLGVHLTFALPTTATFWFEGPVAAGRIGMTLALVSALWGVALTWVAAASPRMGALVALGNYAELDHVAFAAGSYAVVTAFLGAVAGVGLVVGLQLLGSPLAARLLPVVPTGLLFVVAICMQVHQTEWYYLRAHKREPFVGLSLTGGVLATTATLLLGRWHGAVGIAFGLAGVVACFLVPVGTWVFLRCRQAWHAEPVAGGCDTSAGDPRSAGVAGAGLASATLPR